MAVQGRKPKVDEHGNRTARNRNQPTHAWLEVPDLPYDGKVPALPTRYVNGRRVAWSARAKRKWKIWSRMPHCRLWDQAEWDYAVDALELYERFLGGETAAETKLRTREKQLGTTADYRRDLRIRYVNPDAQDVDAEGGDERASEGSVTNLDDWRELYDDGGGDG